MNDSKWNIDTSSMEFLSDNRKQEEKAVGSFLVLIVDDEPEVHQVTKLLLADFRFEGRKLSFLDAYNSKEAKSLLKDTPGIAVIFLDVVMEHNHSGLEVVEYARNELNNHDVRIILRTGQPGEAPEEEIIKKYDINDYRIKTEMTARRMFTSLYSALRSYRDLKRIQGHKIGLEKIIKASSTLFQNRTLEDFLISILDEIGAFQMSGDNLVLFQDSMPKHTSGVVTMTDSDGSRIVAATGEYVSYIGRKMESVPALKEVNEHVAACRGREDIELVQNLSNGFLVCSRNRNLACNYIYIEGDQNSFDFELINLFLSNFSIALDNFMLNNLLEDTQNDFVNALGDTVEAHYIDDGRHTKRIGEMMYRFALIANFSYQEARMLKLAASMHDIGKITVPIDILEKPGTLSEVEYKKAQSHTVEGFKILERSSIPLMKTAAQIALYHHERFDGDGYPEHRGGLNIPLSARMMAIIDVFDAVTHERCYGHAISRTDALVILKDNSGKQFDPKLVELFVENQDSIIDGED